MARSVAEVVAGQAQARVAERGRFRIGLSGGTTPERLYRALASDPMRSQIVWDRTTICFADERGVPPDHPDSNYRLVRERLLEPVGIPLANVHRMEAEAADLEAAARAYEAHLIEPLDVLLLGVGPDGHTASIFPGSALVGECLRWVAAVTESPKPPARRLTITPRVFDETREIAVLVSGEEKAEAVARSLEGNADPRSVPAALLRDRDWYLDRAAARLLGAGTRP